MDQREIIGIVEGAVKSAQSPNVKIGTYAKEKKTCLKTIPNSTDEIQKQFYQGKAWPSAQYIILKIDANDQSPLTNTECLDKWKIFAAKQGYTQYLIYEVTDGEWQMVDGHAKVVAQDNNGIKDYFINFNKRSIPVGDYQVIYFGAPGSGKSYKVDEITKGCMVIRTTFHPDCDYSTFIGAYKPISDEANNGRITYQFVKQAFLKAYLKAWQGFVFPPSSSSSTISFIIKGARYTITAVDQKRLSQTKDLDFPKKSVKNVWDDLWSSGTFQIQPGPQPGRSIPQAISKYIKDNCLDDAEGKDDFETGWGRLLEKLKDNPEVASVNPSSKRAKKYTISFTDSDEMVHVQVDASNSRDRIEECYNDPDQCNGVEEGIVDILGGYNCDSFDEAWDKLTESVKEDHSQDSVSVDGDTTPRPVFLVIEEINRGNCAQVFGDVFQLLDRQDNGFSVYPIESDSEIQKAIEHAFKSEADYKLPGKIDVDYAIMGYNSVFGSSLSDDIEKGRVLLLPPNLFILATMNTSDQSLFPMDSAFKRRWSWEYVPIDSTNLQSQFKIMIGDKTYEWSEFLDEANKRIHKLSDSEDKQMGNFFIKSNIGVDEFKSKVMFYLWSEVCKEYEHAGSFFKNKRDNDSEFTFNSLFPTNDITNGILQGFMEYLGVKEVVVV